MRQRADQKRVWVDTDITIGHRSNIFKYCDVDDGYALTALLRSEQVSVVGVSSTLGNTDDIEVSTRIAKHFIGTYGPNSVPVYKGAAQKLPADPELTATNDAVEHLANALREETLSILAIGAVTNIAVLLLKYPELESRIDELVVVAGRRSVEDHFYSGHHQPKPFRDLNFEFDPRAFAILLESKVELTLVPFEICHQLWIHTEDLVRIGKANKVGRYLAEHSIGWLAEWEILFGSNGFNPFDLVAAGYIIRPDFFSSQQWNAAIEEAVDDTDPKQSKPYLICNSEVTGGKQVRYCLGVDVACKAFLLDRVCTHDMSAFVLGLSHVNVVVPCVDEASTFYSTVLGFEQARDQDGNAMDYKGVEMEAFALDAGLIDGKVNVDVRFLRHPQAGVYLELMAYHAPRGNAEIPAQPKTYDMGGPRHVALEVANCNEVFHYLSKQEGVTMVNTSKDFQPVPLTGFPITFFYWIDKYGIQWEMEEGRRVGVSRGIV